MINITKKVDGVLVSRQECRIAIKYLFRHRREYKSIQDIECAFDCFIREIRGGVEDEKADDV